MEKFDYIIYPSRSIQTDGIKAGLLKSFGFGQVGGEVLVIHPDYVFAGLSEGQYNSYKEKVERRYQHAYRYSHDSLVHQNLIRVKEAPPYSAELETSVYLEPRARAAYDPIKKTWAYNAKLFPAKKKDEDR